MTMRQSAAMLSRSALGGAGGRQPRCLRPPRAGYRYRTPGTGPGARATDERTAGRRQGVHVATTEMREVVSRSGAKEQVSLTGAVHGAAAGPLPRQVSGDRGTRVLVRRQEADGGRQHSRRCSHRRPCRRPSIAPSTRSPSDTTWRCRWAISSTVPPEKALLSDTTTGGYAGNEEVGDTHCYHLAFRDVGVEWELWLPVQGEPLPSGSRSCGKPNRRPMTDVTFTAWNLRRSDRRHVHREAAGGLRGHCDAAEGGSGQAPRGPRLAAQPAPPAKK